VNNGKPGNPVLDNKEAITLELKEFLKSGGSTILDCQPGGCGRDANILVELSHESQVNIVACAGFHRRQYYPSDYPMFNASAQTWTDYILRELNEGMEETVDQPVKIKAGFIKIAIEESVETTPQSALEGSADAAREACAAIEIHTEKGNAAMEVVEYFNKKGVANSQIILCHMDKLMNLNLHKELAKAGILLEYDTFFRPKYSPEENLWILIDEMTKAGLSYRVALATDMAESALYHNLGGGPGLASLPGVIRSRLTKMHIPENNIQQMLGENISRRLAGLN
jgi:phosphotriesterase-related protein